MFWEIGRTGHGLRHNPFKAIVAPRPIGWIGTRSRSGIANLAPYSFFNALHDDPHLVMFSSEGPKDSVVNAEETGVFTTSMVTPAFESAMNASSATVGPEVDEFELAGVTKREGSLVPAPFVAGALAVLECRTTEVIRPRDIEGRPTNAHVIIGQVVAIHIDDSIIRDGKVDLEVARPMARLGYRDYTRVEKTFHLIRPSD